MGASHWLQHDCSAGFSWRPFFGMTALLSRLYNLLHRSQGSSLTGFSLNMYGKLFGIWDDTFQGRVMCQSVP